MTNQKATPRTVIVDSGRSRVKVLCGDDRLEFPAVVAPGREFSMPVRANDPLGAIHKEGAPLLGRSPRRAAPTDL